MSTTAPLSAGGPPAEITSRLVCRGPHHLLLVQIEPGASVNKPTILLETHEKKNGFCFCVLLFGPSVGTFPPTQALPNSLERPDAVSSKGRRTFSQCPSWGFYKTSLKNN